MLERLGEIDWKSRDAEQVPEWLRAFASDDVETRLEAYTDFGDKIVHGGESFQDIDRGYGISSIFKTDVLFLVIPFLLELLDADHVQGKRTLLDFLYEMSTYVHLRVEDDVSHDRARELHAVIWTGSDIFFKLFQYPGKDVRIASVALVTQFLEQAPLVFVTIAQHMEIESDVAVKAVMVWWLCLSLSNDDIHLQSNILKEFITLLHSFLKPEHV